MNYYYALLNEKGICISVDDYGEEVNIENYIRVDTLDTSIIGLYWNGTAFVTPPISVSADHSTDEINYASEDKWLTTKIVEMDANISAKTDKPSTFTQGNFVAFGTEGTLADSGSNASSFASSTHTHDYASTNHTHTEYASASHTHDYASTNHTHSEYANASHSHSNYASSGHTHSDYASTSHSHTEIANDLNVAGVFRVNGKQSVYVNTSASTTTLGTGNNNTFIAGNSYVQVNATNLNTPNVIPTSTNSYNLGSSSNRYKYIYLVNSPNVSSDERLKKEVAEIDDKTAFDFVNAIKPVTYKYDFDDKERVGVIAQDLLEVEGFGEKFVDTDEEGFYSVRPADLVFPLIGAIKALGKEVEELKQKIK